MTRSRSNTKNHLFFGTSFEVLQQICPVSQMECVVCTRGISVDLHCFLGAGICKKSGFGIDLAQPEPPKQFKML